MIPDPLFYKLLLVALVWLCIMLHVVWPSERAAARPTPAEPVALSRKRSREPKPFVGLTRKPHCDACQQARTPRPQAPAASPPPIVTTRGRPRQIDTSHHCCPDPNCAYYGRLGLGNISANGHPNGGPWRQLYCRQCEGFFLRPTAPSFMANAWRPSSSCACSAAWPKAWAFGGRRVYSRWIPTRSFSGSWRRPSNSRPFRAISCARCMCDSFSSTSSMPCSVPSKTGK